MAATGTAAYWRQFYDQRAVQSDPADFMRVLGYHPGPGMSHEELFRCLLAQIRLHLQVEAHHRLLDIACGFGVFTRTLAREAAYAVGTDLAGVLLRRGRDLEAGLGPLGGLVQSRSDAQPFRAGSFDRILCFGMFFHLDRESARRTVAEIVRLLRPGGRALIGDILPPPRIQFERSYIERVPRLLHGPLLHGLRLKAAIDSWRGRVVYQAYDPEFFGRLLPAEVELEVGAPKADGRRNNPARYDVVLQKRP
ncbi:MAG: methyltransferase domain-containing protein [Candidatus Latescibacteria bacterium]|nr:methyltransferase domain-containing protein [Candidatus Latescibacterota bacterium]